MSAFDIERYLEERKSLVNRALDRYLKDSEKQPHTLSRAMRYAVFPGGKRLRPVLLLAAGELFGGKRGRMLPFACALELIHTYSIIHDDLPALDNDDLRRGAPANHKVFGEGMALLAGDALLTEAFYLMSASQATQGVKPEMALEMTRELARAAGAGGMVGGQAVDLEAEGREVDIDTVEYIHTRKTGALIHASVRVGARIGGANPKQLRRISRYGAFLGLVFQIADDILDATGQDGGAEGWGRQSDKERKKATYPSVIGLAASKARAQELLQRCLKELELFGKKADPLRGIARYIVERAL